MTQFSIINKHLTLAVVITMLLFAGKGAQQGGGNKIPQTVSGEMKQI